MNRLQTLTEPKRVKAKRVKLYFDTRVGFVRHCYVFRYWPADTCELPEVLAAIVQRGDLNAFQATAIWLAASTEPRE